MVSEKELSEWKVFWAGWLQSTTLAVDQPVNVIMLTLYLRMKIEIRTLGIMNRPMMRIRRRNCSMMSTIVSVSTCEGDDDDDGDDCDEHHRVRFNLDDLCGDICKSPESFCLLSNLLRSM